MPYSKLLGKVDQQKVNKLEIDGETIEFVTEMKDLGIIIQNDVSWDSQVTSICKKVYKSLYQLRRLASDFPFDVRVRLVQSLVLPYFDYASMAYCDLNSEQIDRLQKAENAIVRFAMRLKIYDHVTPSYKKLEWLRIKEKRKLALAVLMFKILKFRKPAYIFNKFKFMADIHNFGTRHSSKLIQIPRHATSIYNRSFMVQAIKLYNEHVDYFKLELTVEAFKAGFRKLLLENA